MKASPIQYFLYCKASFLFVPKFMTKNSANFDPAIDDVFGRIAKKYDFLCDVFSLGAHRLWKRAMVKTISAQSTGTILDVGSGTGHIALGIARRQARSRGTLKIIASDVSMPMLDIAKAKVARTKSRLPNLSFQTLDAHNLAEIPDSSIDIYTTSFVMKICDRDELIPEALRVLKPGGQFYCLEASRIPIPFLHTVYLKYMRWCTPVIARIATGGDRSAHDYLLKGINDMPDQKSFAQELAEHGLVKAQYKSLSFGIVALHSARAPE